MDAGQISCEIDDRGAPPSTGLREVALTHKITLALLLIGTGFLVGSDGYTLCAHTSLESQIQRAELIFAGTVHRAETTHSSWSGLLSREGLNSTRFVFEDLRYAKGSAPRDSIVLIQMGGGGILVSVMTSFRVGARYIVLAIRGPDDHPATRSPTLETTGVARLPCAIPSMPSFWGDMRGARISRAIIASDLPRLLGNALRRKSYGI